MIPINEAERKKAFLNFLLFFIITIAVILVAVFFSVQVPFKENEKLRREMDLAENERVSLQSFEIKMQETMNLLDSINMSGNFFRTDNDISNNLKTMTTMVSDSSSVKSICTKIIDNLTSLRAAKEQLKNVNNSSEEIVNKDRRIQQLEDNLRISNDRITELIMRSSGK